MSEIGNLNQGFWKRHGSRKECKLFKNPLLVPLYAIFANTMDDEYADLETLISHLPPAWHAPTASWKHMFPTQPPTSQAFLVAYGVCSGFKALKCSPGQTKMGGIITELIENDRYAARNGTEKYVDADSLDTASKLESNEDLDEVAGRLSNVTSFVAVLFGRMAATGVPEGTEPSTLVPHGERCPYPQVARG